MTVRIKGGRCGAWQAGRLPEAGCCSSSEASAEEIAIPGGRALPGQVFLEGMFCEERRCVQSKKEEFAGGEAVKD